jgi:hypothetical protein
MIKGIIIQAPLIFFFFDNFYANPAMDPHVQKIVSGSLLQISNVDIQERQ